MVNKPGTGTKIKVLVTSLVVIAVLISVAGIGLINGNSVVNASKGLTVSKVSLNSLFLDRKDKGLRIEASVTISNPSTVNLELRNVKYVMSVDGAVALNASGAQSFTVPARSTKTVKVTALLKPSDNESSKIIRNIFLTKEMALGIGLSAEVPIKWFNVAQYSTTTVELSGNTTQDVGPFLMAMKGVKESYVNYFTVTGVKWYVNGHEVTEVQQGDYVTAKFTVKAESDLDDAPISVCVMVDVANSVDTALKCENSIKVTLKQGEEKELSITFKAANIPDGSRGFYLDVGPTECHYFGCSLGDVYYETPNHYPPRLKVSNVVPYILVTDAGWYVGGHEVTSVHKGTWVDAKVTLKALTNSHNVKVEFCVRRDYKYWFDKNEKCITLTISLKKEQTTTLTIHFQANHHWLLRGYFMKVKIWEWSEHSWQMPNHYPPRLKVS